MYDPLRPHGQGANNLRSRGPNFGGTITDPLSYEDARDQRAQVHDNKTRPDWSESTFLNLPQPDALVISANDRIGYTYLEQLPALKGHKWDSVARAAVQTLRPSCIRLHVAGSAAHTDAMWWRVTVHMSGGYITKVVQEVKVFLPPSVPDGRRFREALMYDRKFTNTTEVDEQLKAVSS